MKRTAIAGLITALTLPYLTASASDEAGDNSERSKPWANIISEEAQHTTKVPETELGVGVVNGEALRSTWERAQNNPDFIQLSDQIDSNDERLADAEDRIVDLESMVDDAWEEITGTTASSFQPSGSAFNIGPWSPAITNQTSDFTQSRSYDQKFVKETRIYEENKYTGERRLARIESDSKVQTLTEIRTINVASRSDGTGEGWSPWTSIGNFQEQRSIYYFVADTDALVDKKNEVRDMPRSETVSIVVSNDPLSYNNHGINACQTKVAQYAKVNSSQVSGVSVEALRYKVDHWQCGPKGTTSSDCAVVKESQWNSADLVPTYYAATGETKVFWRGSATRRKPGASTITEGNVWGYYGTFGTFMGTIYNKGTWTLGMYAFADPNSFAAATITSYRCSGTVDY